MQLDFLAGELKRLDGLVQSDKSTVFGWYPDCLGTSSRRGWGCHLSFDLLSRNRERPAGRGRLRSHTWRQERIDFAGFRRGGLV
jgi:hypothetical protein